MSASIFSIPSLAERNHRAFVERESRRARQISALGGLRIIEMREELRMPDGTRAWGDWSALTHLPPRQASTMKRETST